MSKQQLTTIYRASSATRAHLLTQLLAEREIPARVVGDAILNVDSLDSAVAVMVPVAHREVALFIAEAFDRHIVGQREEEILDHDVGPTAWHDWPSCPSCQTPRMTWCPFCGTGGNQFELADPATWSTEDALLLCSICDEPFEPQFYRACATCGHRFPDGIEGEPVSDDTAPEVQRTVIAAILFLAAFTCLAWWILRS